MTPTLDLHSNFFHKPIIAEVPTAINLYTALVRKLAELRELRNLIVRDFLPAVIKSIAESNTELFKSKYKSIILANTPSEGMKENYNETIRLGYIALYHKFENFNAILIKEVDNHFEEAYEKKESFKAFAKRELLSKASNRPSIH